MTRRKCRVCFPKARSTSSENNASRLPERFVHKNAQRFGARPPVLFLLTARVPFDRILEAPPHLGPAVFLLGYRKQQLGAVKTRIFKHQHRLLCRHQGFHTGQQPFQKILDLQRKV